MSKAKAILYAILAAAFYAINVPLSKILLAHVGETTMAALLYLGAGIGIGILSLLNRQDRRKAERLSKSDLPFVIGMIVLDIAAPIFLMLGISKGSSANAALLGNFEIVTTTIIALLVFREAVSKRLWAAIALITLASAMLSFEGDESFRFSLGSLFVLLAASCWGLENNCTRRISSKSTYEIVILKGVFSGLGSLCIALIRGEAFPPLGYIAAALLLGFVAYGLSIFLYVRAQSALGAAKTSAYYAVAPFIGAFLCFVLLRERLSGTYLLALAVMAGGTALVVVDTLLRHHAHLHAHTFTHTHDGSAHTHTVAHTHGHNHILSDEKHGHRHSIADLEKELDMRPATRGNLARVAREMALIPFHGAADGQPSNLGPVVAPFPAWSAAEADGLWCAAFVYYCCREAGFDLPIRPKECRTCHLAGCIAWEEWALGDPRIEYHPRGDGFVPEAGDIVLYDRVFENGAHDHMGIVLEKREDIILAAEGNVNNVSGLVEHPLDDHIRAYIRLPDGFRYEARD